MPWAVQGNPDKGHRRGENAPAQFNCNTEYQTVPQRSRERTARPLKIRYVVETAFMGDVIEAIGRRKWDRAYPGGCGHPGCNGPSLVGITFQVRINGEPHPLTTLFWSCKRHTAAMVSQIMEDAREYADAFRDVWLGHWPEDEIDVAVEREEHEPMTLDECRALSGFGLEIA